MLRAEHICTSRDEIQETIDKLFVDQRANVVMIEPRFGPPMHSNSVLVHFSYQNQIICELDIKFGKAQTPLLYYSGRLINHILDAAEMKDAQLLYEVYKASTNYHSNHGLTCDSQLLDDKKETADIKLTEEERAFAWFKERDLRQEIGVALPKYGDLMKSDAHAFDHHMMMLQGTLNKTLCNFLQQDQLVSNLRIEQGFASYRQSLWTPHQYLTFIDLLIQKAIIIDQTLFEIFLHYDVFTVGLEKLSQKHWSIEQFEEFFQLIGTYHVFEDENFHQFMHISNTFRIGLTQLQKNIWSIEQFKQFILIFEEQKAIKEIIFNRSDHNYMLLEEIIHRIELERMDVDQFKSFMKFLFERKFLQFKFLDNADQIDRGVLAGQNKFVRQQIWDSISFRKYINVFYEHDLISLAQLRAQQDSISDDNMLPYILGNMTSACYPLGPKEKLKIVRESFTFDYEKLIENKHMPMYPHEFSTIKCDIEGQQRNLDYFGQVSIANSKIPDGIGLIVDKDGEIIEGAFEHGKFGKVYRQVYSLYADSVDQIIHYRPKPGKEYHIKIATRDFSKPPKFEYAERQKSKLHDEKMFWEGDGGEVAFQEEAGFNYRTYFTFAAGAKRRK